MTQAAPDPIMEAIRSLGDAMMVVARYRCAQNRAEWPEDFRDALEELDGCLLQIGRALQAHDSAIGKSITGRSTQ
ncbi:MAG: hypothetical protein EPN34_12360 [Burkholderiaceae bacterium]|nr:MAG: hypothetical protein EPN34_12360 [Burkholderiaceae bacterium]